MNSVDVYGHFTRVVHGLREYQHIILYQRMRRGVVVNEDVLDSVGLEHDINGMDQGVETMLVLAGIELIFFIVASMRLCF